MSTLNNLYAGTRHALNYRRYRPEYPTKVVAYILEYIDDKRNSKRHEDNNNTNTNDLAVDCGCGSGQFTSLLSPHYRRVLGFDQSSAQIEQARQRRTLVATTSNVAFGVAPSERLPLKTGSVDLITVAQAIHWFDLESFYDECRRIAKPKNSNGSGCFLAIVRPSKPWIEDPNDNSTISEQLTLASDEMYDFLRPYMDHRSEKVVFDWDNFEVPFVSTSDKTMIMERDFTLDQYIGYVTSMSTYIKYSKAVPNSDFLNIYRRKLLDILQPNSKAEHNTQVSMKFRLDIIMAQV